jgi:hypothetical protein
MAVDRVEARESRRRIDGAAEDKPCGVRFMSGSKKGPAREAPDAGQVARFGGHMCAVAREEAVNCYNDDNNRQKYRGIYDPR